MIYYGSFESFVFSDEPGLSTYKFIRPEKRDETMQDRLAKANCQNGCSKQQQCHVMQTAPLLSVF